MLLQTLMQLSQIYTPGPAISLRTSAWLLPQNEHMVRFVARAIVLPLGEQLLFLRFAAAAFRFARMGAIQPLHFLARLNDFVDQPVGLRFWRRHVIIAVRIQPHLVFRFAAVLRATFN